MAEHQSGCVFCGIVAGTEPATIIREWPDALAFTPLGPVVPGGHTLVVPRQHVANAVQDPAVTAATMLRAVEPASEHEFSNILTSTGRPATQSVFHLHLHVIRRTAGDQLMVPWGTTGDPQDPHSCKRSETAEREARQLRRERDDAHATAAAYLATLERYADEDEDSLRAQRDGARARLAELGRPIRDRIEAKIRPAMLLGLQDAELYGEPGAQRISEWVAWIADALTETDLEVAQ